MKRGNIAIDCNLFCHRVEEQVDWLDAMILTKEIELDLVKLYNFS